MNSPIEYLPTGNSGRLGPAFTHGPAHLSCNPATFVEFVGCPNASGISDHPYFSSTWIGWCLVTPPMSTVNPFAGSKSSTVNPFAWSKCSEALTWARDWSRPSPEDKIHGTYQLNCWGLR